MSDEQCEHVWPTPGCPSCDSTVKPWTVDGVSTTPVADCPECKELAEAGEWDEPIPYVPASEIRLGSFTVEGETFAWGPHPSAEYEGFTAVFDQYDLILSVGLTPELAIRGARLELELISDEIDDAINQILGWSNDAE
jgi:hypothetical protein